MGTIQDVAQKAGVSVSTVYKVFSDSYKTRDEIRERVLKACEELNYSHHSMIKKRKLLGMMFSEVTNSFTNTLMQMIIDELGDEYDIVTLYSNEDLTREKQNITCLEQMKVDALIFATVSNQEYPEINKMISDGKPVIQFFMQTHPGADAILFDDELGTYQAVKYLIQNGHKDILMLYKYRIGFPQRSNGYRKAFEEEGLEVDERYLYDIPYNDSIRGVIQNKIQELKPSAILAVNEIIAKLPLYPALSPSGRSRIVPSPRKQRKARHRANPEGNGNPFENRKVRPPDSGPLQYTLTPDSS